MRTALDTETRLIASGRLAPQLVCVSKATSDKDSTVLDAEDGAREAERLLHEETVWHNAPFDLGVLVQHRPRVEGLVWSALDDGRVHDTFIHEKLARIATGESAQKPPLRYSLAACVQRRLGETMEGKSGDDAWRFRYRELIGIPIADWPAAAVDYARHDAELTIRLHDAQQDDGEPPTRADQARGHWGLHLTSAWGLRTDPVAVAALRTRLEESVASQRQYLLDAKVLRPTGSKDMKAIRARVEAALGDAAPKTAKGAVSTAESVLRESGDPVLEALASIAKDQKELDAFVPVLERGIWFPINPGYDPLKDTGRSSSFDPNIQQMPRRIGVRECFVPRPGWVYVAVDYDIAELVALGQTLLDWFGRSKLADVINDGLDVHMFAAVEMFGGTYEEAWAARKTELWKGRRTLLKALDFGIPGGLGAESFAAFAKASYGVDLSVERARELIRWWKGQFPEMKLYFDRIGAQSRHGTFTYTHHSTGFVRGQVGYTNGCNMSFQHMVAMGAKAALYEVQRESRMVEGSPLYQQCRPVAFIHDEIMSEMRRGPGLQAAIDRKKEIMVREMKRFCPDVRVGVGADVLDRWRKT